MADKHGQNSQGRHAKKKSALAKFLIAFVSTLALVSICMLATYVFFDSVKPRLGMLQDSSSSSLLRETSLTTPSSEPSSFSSLAVLSDTTQQALDPSSEEEPLAPEPQHFPTPLIAERDGVLFHSPIRADQLEGIIFHQASYETALTLTTQLPSADVEKMEENPDYEIAVEQPTGDTYLRAKALHLWREDTLTDMDTSIDLGAEAGTQVYAPVTGTVVLVRTYDLYDTCTDYEVHIQPDGRPDLDVVEIHIDKVCVKAGDWVEGGVTPIAIVRDLAAEDITDIQLAYYTKEGHGNHTHVQVNNANDPEYRKTRLKDAYKVE